MTTFIYILLLLYSSMLTIILKKLKKILKKPKSLSTVGQVDHGKSTWMAAFMKVISSLSIFE